MFKDIYLHLKNYEIDVYSIGQHNGICKTGYVVIKNNGVSKEFGYFKKDEFEVILYYPYGSYTKALDFFAKIDEIISHIDKLEREYNPTPIVYDDDKKAYTTSLIYKLSMYY